LPKNALPQSHRARDAAARPRHVRRRGKLHCDCISGFDVALRRNCGKGAKPVRRHLQKFIVGREIRQLPQVMVVAQPTWGVDVGRLRRLIRQQIIDLARAASRCW